MTARDATDQEIGGWNKLILANPDHGNVFQSTELAILKQQQGWKPRYIHVDNIAITVLEKSVIGLGNLWYIPKGPGVADIHQLETLLPELRTFAREQGVFTVKIEPELARTDENLASLLKLNLRKVRPIQPNFSTVLIDLSPDTETILMNLNQKGRHAIRRAERDGVTVVKVPSTDDSCKIMYDLLATTAEGSFGIRPYSYYKDYWQTYEANGYGKMFFAYADNQIVASAYALVFGAKSTYKDGASVRERPVYGASHLLQWHVIQWAKENGSIVHDLCGAPPSDQIKNPDHPHYGIGRFKTSFNKNVTDYVGAYDIVINPSVYAIWARFGERILLRWHYKRHREGYY